MGSATSVQAPEHEDGENTKFNEINLERYEDNSALRNGNENTKVLRRYMNHSQVLDEATKPLSKIENNAKNPMRISTTYLAEENVRLQLANEKLTKQISIMCGEVKNEEVRDDSVEDEIFGESTQQRLKRLEKHLASERREKWSAIEFSEKTRVDLVNCEKELAKSNELIKTLTEQLEETKKRGDNLEKIDKSVGTISEGEKSSGEPQTGTRESLHQFRIDLKAKREARQRALLGITTEMNGLRDELSKERAIRRKLERELEASKQISPDISLESVISDNNSLRNEIDILTENAERLKNVSSENIRLKFEAKRLNAEMDSLNLNLGELKFEYYDEKRKHERTMRRLKELENASEGEAQSKHGWEEEKEKFYEKYDQEKEEITKRTNALKEVITITRQMLAIRESQVHELKIQLKDIEESVKKSRIMEENGLKAEYEKQLENIRNLKALYEERVRLMEFEKKKNDEIIQDKEKTMALREKEIADLHDQLESNRRETNLEREERESMDRELRLTVAKCKDLENELNLINNMFTQMLLGPFNSGQETDLDKLTELLQENHDLIREMTTKEDSSEIASVLPKLLLDLITQVDEINDRREESEMVESCETISEQSESLLAENQGAVLPILSYKDATLFNPLRLKAESTVEEFKGCENNKPMNDGVMNSAVQEIASNLPKVWRVLMELLSHHSIPEEPNRGDEKQCYKKVDTPNGPRTVISVSKTFIRLKDLILEKKGLQKELTRLKQLNSHLETRLDDQEKRLSQVQCELHKTWGIVGRMRSQHQQLHNHEKILRYELQEKRVMLSELKQELEYCRDKWEKARQKNDESETEWKKLRREFAARKIKAYASFSLNDSGESGFSDEQNESGEDCDADRSSTQSPVDLKLLESIGESQVNFPHLPTLEAGETAFNLTESTAKPNIKTTEANKPSLSSAISEETASEPGDSRIVDDREKAREARDLRLRNLEEQCKLLVRQVDITKHKSNYLNNRLEELHEQYGTSEEIHPQPSTSGEAEVENSTRDNKREKENSVSGPCDEEQPEDKTP